MITFKTLTINPNSASQPPLTRGSQWLHSIHPVPSMLEKEYEESFPSTTSKVTSSQLWYSIFRISVGLAFIFAAICQLREVIFTFGFPQWTEISCISLIILGVMLGFGLGGRYVPLIIATGFVVSLIFQADANPGKMLTPDMLGAISGGVASAIFVLAGTGRLTLDKYLSKLFVWKLFK